MDLKESLEFVDLYRFLPNRYITIVILTIYQYRVVNKLNNCFFLVTFVDIWFVLGHDRHALLDTSFLIYPGLSDSTLNKTFQRLICQSSFVYLCCTFWICDIY